MSSITTIQSTDLITDSRANINDNFANLNTDKIETSVLDTDTTLAANSDSKVATQKAVKAYVDAGGNVNATETTKGIVEIATQSEVISGAATGGTGASIVITPAQVAETGNDKIIKTKSTGLLDASIVPPITTSAGTTTQDISTTTTKTIAHGLGSTPTLVRVVGMFSSGDTTGHTEAIIEGATTFAIHTAYEVSTGINGTGFVIYENASGGAYITGTVTVDATNISITWSKTGSPTGTAQLLWSAIK